MFGRSVARGVGEPSAAYRAPAEALALRVVDIECYPQGPHGRRGCGGHRDVAKRFRFRLLKAHVEWQVGRVHARYLVVGTEFNRCAAREGVEPRGGLVREEFRPRARLDGRDDVRGYLSMLATLGRYLAVAPSPPIAVQEMGEGFEAPHVAPGDASQGVRFFSATGFPSWNRHVATLDDLAVTVNMVHTAAL